MIPNAKINVFPQHRTVQPYNSQAAGGQSAVNRTSGARLRVPERTNELDLGAHSRGQTISQNKKRALETGVIHRSKGGKIPYRRKRRPVHSKSVEQRARARGTTRGRAAPSRPAAWFAPAGEAHVRPAAAGKGMGRGDEWPHRAALRVARPRLWAC